MKIANKVASVGAGLFLVAASLAGAAAPASASTHDAVIKYASGAASSIQVCHSAASPTSCASGVAWLPKGKNTKTYFGWADADLFWLNSGQSAGGFRGPTWVKVAGCNGCTYSVYLN